MRSRPKSRAAFAYIATGLAIHLGLIPECTDLEEVLSLPITTTDLKNVHFLRSDTEMVPHGERDCVLKLRAQRNDEASSSRQAAGAMDDEDDREEYQPASRHSPPPFAYNYPAPPEVPHYFVDFQNQFFNQLQQVQQNQQQFFDQFNNNFQSLRTDVQPNSATLASINDRMGGMDNRIASLEEQWNSWTGLHPSQFSRQDDPFDPST